MTNEDRIIRLEEEIAYLRTTNEELSGELALQWKRIEQLENLIKVLETRFSGLEETLDGPAEDTRPPHW